MIQLDVNTERSEELQARAIERGTDPDLVLIATQILRRKKTIFATIAMCLLLGALAWLLMPTTYSATTELLPPQHAQSTASNLLNQVGGASGSLISGMSGAFEAKSSADMYARMLTARPVLDALVRRFNLQAAYKRRSPADAARALMDRTTITTLKEGFITLRVDDRNGARAAAIANGYVEMLRNLMQSLALTEASQRRLFYEQQLSQAKENLSQAEVAFKQMQQTDRMISLGDESKALIEAAAVLRAQISAKQVQLQGLRATSTEMNPQVEIAERELAALREELGKAEARDESGFSGLGLSSVPGAGLKFVRANRELRYQEELYNILFRQYEAARLDEARDAPLLQVIEPAVPPEHKSSPRGALILLISVVAGLIVGIARVLVAIWAESLTPLERQHLADLREALHLRQHTDQISDHRPISG